MSRLVRFVILSLISITQTAALKCNGMTDLCDLDISQVTLAGSHNSGAGFDGILDYHTPIGKVDALSCFYRNQKLSFKQQLSLGVRYFDIDSCWEDNYKPNSAWICHSGAYGGSIKKMIQQIDDWMNEPANRNEVIVIHFNRDFDRTDSDKTGADIIKQLSDKWEPSNKQLAAGQLAIETSVGRKLGESIKKNQRIHIIMHTSLSGSYRKPWIISQWNVGFTWTSMTFLASSGCKNLMNAMGETRCRKEASHRFVRYDMYLSSGLCVDDLASVCRKYIKTGVEKCFKGTYARRRTVNFIVVDYVGSEVINAAVQHNKRNIKVYLGRSV